jgi:hypothetical protein
MAVSIMGEIITPRKKISIIPFPLKLGPPMALSATLKISNGSTSGTAKTIDQRAVTKTNFTGLRFVQL